MLVVLVVSHVDVHLAKPLSRWIAYLGGVARHRLLINWDPEVGAADRKEILDNLIGTFKSINQMEPALGPQDRGWPAGPNKMFEYTVAYAPRFSDGGPFFFMESDLVPLNAEWADLLEDEYARCGKPFMGVVQQSWMEPIPGQKLPAGAHLVGIAVYPKDVADYTRAYVNQPRIAFDVAMQDDIIGRGLAAHTGLIAHNWLSQKYTRDTDGSLICEAAEGRISGQIGYALPKRVPPGTRALVHGCKDTSLLDLLWAETHPAEAVFKVASEAVTQIQLGNEPQTVAVPVDGGMRVTVKTRRRNTRRKPILA